jgi:hypothetical protein
VIIWWFLAFMILSCRYPRTDKYVDQWSGRESSSRESPAAIELWIIDGPVSGLMSNQFRN